MQIICIRTHISIKLQQQAYFFFLSQKSLCHIFVKNGKRSEATTTLLQPATATH